MEIGTDFNGVIVKKPLSFLEESDSVYRGGGLGGAESSTEQIFNVDANMIDASHVLPVPAERYRLALISAKLDAGLRTMCTSGRGCAQDSLCGFCPAGVLRPQPADGYERYPFAVNQARALWFTAFQEILPRHVTATFGDMSVSSLGATLLASHPQGHCCVASAFHGVFDRSVPHAVKSLSGVQSWARSLKLKPRAGIDKLLVVLRLLSQPMSDASGVEAVEVIHCFQVDGCVWRPFTEISVLPFSASGTLYSISMQCVSFAMSLKIKTPLVFDRGYYSSVTNECIARECSTMPEHMHYCSRCAWTVLTVGHIDRCTVGGHVAVQDMIMKRAQIGDLLHAQDILLLLMSANVPGSKRTQFLTEYKDGAAQAAFMRFAGYDGSDGVLSTWFEAAYDYFRPYYFYVMCGHVPNDRMKVITHMLPSALDPSGVQGTPAPDYTAAWQHICTVSGGSGPPDDPVVIAYQEVRRGQSDRLAAYTSRYTTFTDKFGPGFLLI